MFRSFMIVLVALVLSGAISRARADDTVLTIRSAGGVIRTFTMAELEAMPKVGFTTKTVWTEGPHQFTGPSLKAVLEAAGAQGTTISARALNDYAIQIPFDSLEDGAPIIATRIDGAHFPRREKGPLWIVYPYDSARKYQAEIIYGRSIWQLVDLSVD